MVAKKRAAAKKTLRKAITRGSAAALARAERIVERILFLKKRIADDFFEIGKLLREALKHKLYARLGHRSLAEMVEARGLFSASQADRLLAIVERVPREVAMELGLEKSYEVARYVEATRAADDPQTVLQEGIVVRGKRRPLSEITTRELAALTKRARDKNPDAKKRDAGRAAADRAAKEALAILQKRFGKGVTIDLVRRGDEWFADLRIPIRAITK